jgi:hypothetical protein
MAEAPRAAFFSVLLIVCGMGFIVAGGGLALAWISPEFVDATLAGLGGEGERGGILLFGVQLLAFFAVATGLLVWAWRRG